MGCTVVLAAPLIMYSAGRNPFPQRREARAAPACRIWPAFGPQFAVVHKQLGPERDAQRRHSKPNARRMETVGYDWLGVGQVRCTAGGQHD